MIRIDAKSRSLAKSVLVMTASEGTRSAAAGRLFAARDFGQGPDVGADRFRNCLAINELPLTAAGDQPGFAEDFEMVRDRRGGDAAHRDDLAAGHLACARNGLKDTEAGLVGQGFGYFVDLGTFHGPMRSVSESLGLPPGRS